MTKPVTIEQRLVRNHPELMREWRDDKNGDIDFDPPKGINDNAIYKVDLRFSDGRIAKLELPIG